MRAVLTIVWFDRQAQRSRHIGAVYPARAHTTDGGRTSQSNRSHRVFCFVDQHRMLGQSLIDSSSACRAVVLWGCPLTLHFTSMRG